MKKNRPTIRKAFTLVELGIVLVIMAILIAGVMEGASMISASKMLGARSHTAKSSVSKINGLVAWYETSLQDSFVESETSQATQLSQWNDIGPSLNTSKNNNLTKTATSNVLYEEDGINSITSVKLDAETTDSKITLASFYQNSLAQSTVFIVFSPLGLIPTQETLLDSDTSGSTAKISINAASVVIDAGTALSGSTTVTSSESYILCASFNSTLSSIYFNDADTKLGSGDAGTNSLSGLTIGSNKSGTERFNGLISEVIVYDNIVGLQDRRDIFRYLADKYDVAVDGI